MEYKKIVVLSIVALSALYAIVFAGDLATKPRVSIVTSVYNGVAFLPFFMQDIVQQVEFERYQLIMINASSPTRKQEDTIIENYMKKYPNIEYYHLASDPGIYGVWNMAIRDMAKADYIMNANLDDALKIDAIKVMADELDKNPHIDLVWGEFYISYAPNQSWQACASTGCNVWHSEEFSLKALAEATLVGNHPMWRKSAHQKAGYFDASYHIAGDWDMWARMALSGCIFKKIHANLGVYYANPAGLSTWRSDGKAVKERNKVIDTYSSVLAKNHKKRAKK